MENHAVALEVGVGGVQGEVSHGVVASFVHCIGASFVEGCLRISSVLIRMSSGGAYGSPDVVDRVAGDGNVRHGIDIL